LNRIKGVLDIETYGKCLKFARVLEYQKTILTTAKKIRLETALLRNINPVLLKILEPKKSKIEKIQLDRVSSFPHVFLSTQSDCQSIRLRQVHCSVVVPSLHDSLWNCTHHDCCSLHILLSIYQLQCTCSYGKYSFYPILRYLKHIQNCTMDLRMCSRLER
jgi:hypothetical protein